MNGRIDYAIVEEIKVAPEAPYNPYASGYGNKIPTRYSALVNGSTRWRRVWAICYSNAASFYVIYQGERCFIRDMDLEGK